MRSPWMAAVVFAAAVASPCLLARAQVAPPATTGRAVAPRASEAPQPPARPFGPGTPVDVQCDKPYVYVFVAKGIVDPGAVFPDPFVKVGRAPVQLELPAGVYTVLAEGEAVPSAHTVFAVQQRPVHVHVDAGSQGLRNLGTLGIALGGIAVLAAGALELSGTKDEDATESRKISIPLLVGGGVALLGGITALLVSGSSVEHDGFVPTPQHEAPRTGFRGLVVLGRF